MQHMVTRAGVLIVGMVILSCHAAQADQASPIGTPAASPPPILNPSPPSPPPPPPPPWYVFSLTLGLGALVFDHARAGCPTCEGVPPALETSLAAGLRLTPWLALGVQGQAHVEFMTGDPRNDSRFGAFAGFVYGQLTLPSIFQILAGFGYGTASYQYTVPGLFASVDKTDPAGSGVATLVAGRIRLRHVGRAELALEARYTTISLGAAGPEHGFTFSLAGGFF